MGEGEEVTHELLDLYLNCKKQGLTGLNSCMRLAMGIEGVYVPRFYTVEYKEDGTISRIEPINERVPKP